MEEDPQNPPPSISLSSATPPTSLPPPPLPPPPPLEEEEQQPALKKTKMSSTSTTDDDTTTTTTVQRPRRYKRRSVAIFFAYCGVGYQGMQKNPGAKTIEGDLEEALYLTGAVPEEERGQHKRYDWARSARTDKGVSAVGQVVSGKFFVDPPGFVERLNSVLPPQIRIFGYKRATPSFSAKKFCDRRRYVYLLPVFALDPSCHRDRESVKASLGSGEELVRCVECSERGRKVVGVMGNKRDAVIEGLVQSAISSNTCDALMLDVGEKVDEGGRGGGCLDAANGEAGCLKFDVDGVRAEVLAQSGISSNNCDAPVVQVKEGESNVLVANENVQLKTDVGVVEAEVLGISSNNDDAVMLGVEEEKVKEGEKDNSCLKNVGGEGEGVGEESKNDAGAVNPAALLNAELKKKEECRRSAGVEDNGGAESKSDGAEEGAKERKSEFKYGEEVKERLNRILKYYEGTHNFHNFTTRTKPEDPSAKRYIVSFEANTTLTIEGIEFVKCEVVGQSFMLHQIRKLMGMAVAVMRNFAPESIYETAFDQTVRINVPTAPEVGLYLDECFFTSYNNKWHGTHEEVSMKAYAEEAEEFKLKYIYSHIAKTEHKEGAVAVWLHSLNRRNYPDLCQSEEVVEVAADASEEVVKVAADASEEVVKVAADASEEVVEVAVDA